MPSDQDKNVDPPTPVWMRAIWALPLLAVAYVFEKTFTITIYLLPSFEEAKATGKLVLGNEVVGIWTKFFGLEKLDNFISTYVAFFTPGLVGFDPAGRMQMIAFLGDLIPLQTIWLIESARRGNNSTVAGLLPTLLSTLYQIKGIGFIAPIYYFFHYIQSPLKKYAAAASRMTQIGAVKTIIPTVTISYIVPGIAMFVAPKLAMRQWINGLIWQPFPIYAAILQYLLGRFVNDTTQYDSIRNPSADMPWLRCAYVFSATFGAAANIYARLASPVSLKDVFFQGTSDPHTAVTILHGTAKSLRYDHICCFAATAIWIVLSFKDLKQAKKIQAGWGKILGLIACINLVAGPGAAMATMWAWREEALAKRDKTKDK